MCYTNDRDTRSGLAAHVCYTNDRDTRSVGLLSDQLVGSYGAVLLCNTQETLGTGKQINYEDSTPNGPCCCATRDGGETGRRRKQATARETGRQDGRPSQGDREVRTVGHTRALTPTILTAASPPTHRAAGHSPRLHSAAAPRPTHIKHTRNGGIKNYIE